MERAKLWRCLGRALDTDLGTRLLEAVGPAVNKAGAYSAPRLVGEAPWTELVGPLADRTVTLISTAGLYVDGDQPFDVDAVAGDPTYRAIAANVDPGALRIAHAHYPRRHVRADVNVLLPLDRLRELHLAKVFRLAPRLFSFGFGGMLTAPYVTEPDGTAHQLARELRRDQADLALLVPA